MPAPVHRNHLEVQDGADEEILREVDVELDLALQILRRGLVVKKRRRVDRSGLERLFQRRPHVDAEVGHVDCAERGLRRDGRRGVGVNPRLFAIASVRFELRGCRERCMKRQYRR